jgi:hypothetical protein
MVATSQATFIPAGLYDTGVDASGASLAGNSVDTHYTLDGGNAVVVNAGFPIPPWLDYSAPNGASRWVSVNSSGGGGPDASFTYVTTFFLGNAAGLTLSGKWSSDNDSDVFLNNILIGHQNFSDGGVNSFEHYNSFNNSLALANGLNTLTFVVHNGYVPPQGGDAGPFGLRAESLTVVPEPTTMIAGALLLLPFGASTLRVLRRNRAA